jgi:hypothetical protein
MKQLLKLFVIIMAFQIVSSNCTYDTLPTPKIEVPDSVSLSNNVIPLINELGCNNSGCHMSGGVTPDLTPENAYSSLVFQGYVKIDDPLLSPVYQKITAGSMERYANDEFKAILLAWIQQGALDN